LEKRAANQHRKGRKSGLKIAAAARRSTVLTDLMTATRPLHEAGRSFVDVAPVRRQRSQGSSITLKSIPFMT
jgi:hypothetical protein